MREDWSPDYVNKIEEALKVTQEQNSQSGSQNSSPTVLLTFKLMCPKLNWHLNSKELQHCVKDCDSPTLKPHLSFRSFHDPDTMSFKKLFHPSLATYPNSLCYGNPNNQ